MMGALAEAGMLETRVVILDHEQGPEVGVVEIPYPAAVGVEFEHDGRWWRVLGRRAKTRVLLAAESSRVAPLELRA
jgi:hypothetical protein